MPELRKDPISQRWVIIASERAKHPSDFLPETPCAPPSFDPFAEGNEDKTPPEIAAYRDPGSAPNKPGWRVRVVPNKFPALQIEGSLEPHGDGIYDRMRGIGAHEVIIESPRCVRSLTSLSDGHIQEVLWMYRDRLLDLQRDKRLKYGMLFKNVGPNAGATLFHTHSQLIVTPIVPRTIHLKMLACEEYFKFRGRCLVCDMLTQEHDQQVRVVLDTGQFLAFAPYAPRFPFETWIMPKHHGSHFEHLDRPHMEELAFTLKRTLLKIEKGVPTL